MDRFVQQILYGECSEQHRESLLHTVLQNGKNVSTKQEVLGILEMTSECIIVTTEKTQLQYARKVFLTWAVANTSTLREFCNPDKIIFFLENRTGIGNAIILVHNILDILQLPHADHYALLCAVVQSRVLQLVKAWPQFFSISCLCKLLMHHSDCQPTENDRTEFCCSILQAASFFSTKFVSHEDKPKKVMKEINEVIGGLVGRLWATMADSQINVCLGAILDILQAAPEPGRAPSSALAGIVQHLPVSIISSAVDAVLSNPEISDEKLLLILNRILYWAVWPKVINIDKWVVSFFQGCILNNKYSLFTEAVQLNISLIFQRLQLPIQRETFMNILKFVLLAIQDSPDVFHKVAEEAPQLVNQLRREIVVQKSEEQRVKIQQFLDDFAELMHTLMSHFQGFPDIYAPLVTALSGITAPTEDRQACLLREYALNKPETQTKGQHVYSRSLSTTGFRGLQNLTNTCYMNSILQVLFICDSFRISVLLSTCSFHQNVLSKLQLLFAFLSSSLRPVIAPVDFYEASRPAYFAEYQQQDCSEFLQQLFNKLEEETSKPAGSAGSSRHASKSVEQATPLPKSPSLVKKLFGGKLQYAHKCLKCGTISTRSETFHDIGLAFPSDSNSRSQTLLRGGMNTRGSNKPSADNDDGSSQQVLTMSLVDLFNNYLQVEQLVGSEQYECEKCCSRQDAERWICFERSPEYLIVILLRFSYSIKSNNQSKIFTNLHYPKTLHVPVISDEDQSGDLSSASDDSQPTRSRRSRTLVHTPETANDTYCLCGVVVHSGCSSHSGHYYSYGRHAEVIPELTQDLPHLSEPGVKTQVQASEVDYLQDKWFYFNDDRVNATEFSSIRQLSQTFRHDTPYVLVYKKITAATPVNVSTPALTPVLSWHVAKDNQIYQQEKEKENKRRSNVIDQNMKSYWNNDRQDPPGSCGGAGGFGGINNGPKFIF